MAEYHVGCGVTGIFAGTLNKKGNMWLNKSNVTDEAIMAVVDWLLMERGDKKRHGYSFKMKNGSIAKLILEVEDNNETTIGVNDKNEENN